MVARLQVKQNRAVFGPCWPPGRGPSTVINHSRPGAGHSGELAKGADGLTWLGHGHRLRNPNVRRLKGLLAQPNISWHKKAFMPLLESILLASSVWFIYVWLLLALQCSPFPKHAFPYLSLHLVISELCLCILIMFLQSWAASGFGAAGSWTSSSLLMQSARG